MGVKSKKIDGWNKGRGDILLEYFSRSRLSFRIYKDKGKGKGYLLERLGANGLLDTPQACGSHSTLKKAKDHAAFLAKPMKNKETKVKETSKPSAAQVQKKKELDKIAYDREIKKINSDNYF